MLLRTGPSGAAARQIRRPRSQAAVAGRTDATLRRLGGLGQEPNPAHRLRADIGTRWVEPQTSALLVGECSPSLHSQDP